MPPWIDYCHSRELYDMIGRRMKKSYVKPVRGIRPTKNVRLSPRRIASKTGRR